MASESFFSLRKSNNTLLKQFRKLKNRLPRSESAYRKELPLTGCNGTRQGRVFLFLHLHETAEHNGVLFYLAYEDRKFAVLGDKGIDEKVTADFWDSTKELLRSYFKAGQFKEGLRQGILRSRSAIEKTLSLPVRRHQRTARRHLVWPLIL